MEYFQPCNQDSDSGYLSDLTEDSTESVVDLRDDSTESIVDTSPRPSYYQPYKANHHQVYETYCSNQYRMPIHVYDSPHYQVGRHLEYTPKYQADKHLGFPIEGYNSPMDKINHVGIVPSLVTENVITNARDKDVLCGRGAPTNLHPGNQSFRKLIKFHQTLYLRTRRSDKPLIAMKIVEEIKLGGGKFLKRNKQKMVRSRGHFAWVELSEQQAYEKTCQALREGAPKIRQRMQLSKACNNSNNDFAGNKHYSGLVLAK